MVMHKTPAAVFFIEIQNCDGINSDWHTGTTSQTEQIVIDPLLLADAPAQVNELTQEISNQFLNLWLIFTMHCSLET